MGKPLSAENHHPDLTRRTFVKAAASAAAFTIVPRHVLAGSGQTPPSEKLNIAAVGVGGMGRNNIKACEHENIVALCDVDWDKAAAQFEDYPKAKRYKDFRKMLETEKSIDAVIVATPDHTHAVPTMMAVRMGKHVYVQKPLTYSVYEARKLTEAAREYKVATQMGNQGHSSEGIRLVREWIQAGVIGAVREVHVWTNRPFGRWGWPQGVERPKDSPSVPPAMDWDLWIGPAPYRPYHPAYHPSKWRGWLDFGTGALGDMGCHIIDTPFWALDLEAPVSVEATTTPINSETFPIASFVTFKFPSWGEMPPVTMMWYDGGLMPPRPEELEPGRRMGSESGGILFVGDKGKLIAGPTGGAPRLIPESKMKKFAPPAKTIPRIEGTHEQDWLEACRGGAAACCNFDYAGPLTETVLLGCVAVRTRQKLYWDHENMEFKNSPEATPLLHRAYRNGWSL